MPLRRIQEVALRTERPNWLTAGTLRLGVLSAFVVAVGMIRPRLSPGEAGVLVAVGAGATVGSAVAFYYAVSTAFVSPAGDIAAATRGARSATLIEMLTAFALLTAYLSSLVDWKRPPPPE